MWSALRSSTSAGVWGCGGTSELTVVAKPTGTSPSKPHLLPDKLLNDQVLILAQRQLVAIVVHCGGATEKVQVLVRLWLGAHKVDKGLAGGDKEQK